MAEKNNYPIAHPRNPKSIVDGRPIPVDDFLQRWDMRAGADNWEQIPMTLIDHQVVDGESYIRPAVKPEPTPVD